jgi:hypothetical protein
MQQEVVAALAAHIERAVLDVRNVVVDVVVAVHERDNERAPGREPPRGDVPRVAKRFVAASTLSRVAWRTFGSRFSTRETVLIDTPACRATSSIVLFGSRFFFIRLP